MISLSPSSRPPRRNWTPPRAFPPAPGCATVGNRRDVRRRLQRQSEPLPVRQPDSGHATGSELRDNALQILEERGKSLAPFQKDHLDKLLRTANENMDGAKIARRLIVTESDAYRSAFQKAVTQSQPAFSPEEARAINEFRAASEGTGSAGGFGIPVLIDPSIILTIRCGRRADPANQQDGHDHDRRMEGCVFDLVCRGPSRLRQR